MSPFEVYVSIKSKGSCYGLKQGISKKYWHKWCKKIHKENSGCLDWIRTLIYCTDWLLAIHNLYTCTHVPTMTVISFYVLLMFDRKSLVCRWQTLSTFAAEKTNSDNAAVDTNWQNLLNRWFFAKGLIGDTWLGSLYD